MNQAVMSSTGSDERPKKSRLQMNVAQASGFVWEMFLMIALPTVVCALLGRWLDRRYGLRPWATMIGLVAALGIVYLLVRQRIRKIFS